MIFLFEYQINSTELINNLNPKKTKGGGIKTQPVQMLAILSRMKVGVSILHVITIFGV